MLPDTTGMASVHGEPQRIHNAMEINMASEEFKRGTPVMDCDKDIFFVVQTKEIEGTLKVELNDVFSLYRSAGWAAPEELSKPDAAAWLKWFERS